MSKETPFLTDPLPERYVQMVFRGKPKLPLLKLSAGLVVVTEDHTGLKLAKPETQVGISVCEVEAETERAFPLDTRNARNFATRILEMCDVAEAGQ